MNSMRNQGNPKVGGVSSNRKRQGKARRSVATFPLRIQLSYPGQVSWDVWIPFNPIKLTTTVTTGLIANALPIVPTAVASFASRFQSTFVEYRMVQVRVRVKMFSSTNPGVMQFWFDEKSNATPTLVEAAERYILSVSASDTKGSHQLLWTARDPLDLEYTAISTSVTPVTFKSYTSNANFGSSIVATDYCEVEGHIRFQFRGLLGV